LSQENGQRNGLELVTEQKKQRRGKGLSENVSYLICHVDIASHEFLVYRFFPNKVIINFNMFTVGIKD
jgi:hypothetical protein